MSLDGVGRKTAQVVLAQAFGVPAFPVDTHIERLAKRWRLSKGKNALQVERDLKSLFDPSVWNKLHLQYHISVALLVSGVLVQDRNHFKTFEDFHQFMVKSFEPERDEFVARTEFLSCKQEKRNLRD